MVKAFIKKEYIVHVFMWQVVILALILCGAFWFTEKMIFSNEFGERRQKSHNHLLLSAENQMAAVTNAIRADAMQLLRGNDDSRAQMDSLNTHLDRLAAELETIAITDRSASLDNIFERYSVLVALTALLFAIIGIYSGIHFKDQMSQMKRELLKTSQQLDKQVKEFDDRIRQKSDNVKNRLDEVVDQSMNMIWMVGNSLEILTNVGAIDSERASTLLDSIYKTGFRFELHSPNPKERLSALHNLYAQGDCEDLPALSKMCRDAGEKKDIRRLAWRAIQKILKRCPHQDGHADLSISNDDLFDDPEKAD